jgi:hypothetical protein
MNDRNIPFQTIDWTKIPKTEHKGETGVAYWQTLQFEGLRIVNEQQDGTKSILTPGMSYVVSDELSSHRSVSENGVKLMIIDGDFLKLKK